jgi:hypothetical protein
MFKVFKNVIDWFTAPVARDVTPVEVKTNDVAASIKQAVTEGATRGGAGAVKPAQQYVEGGKPKPRNRRRKPKAAAVK